MISDITLAISHFFQSDLLLHETGHVLVTFVFAYFLYKRTKSKKLFWITILTTFAIDLDHLIDYFFVNGLHISLYSFLKAGYFKIAGKAYVFAHAWEWIGILAIIGEKRGGWKSLYAAIALGMLSHLIWDSIHIESFMFYSILYRLSLGFVL